MPNELVRFPDGEAGAGLMSSVQSHRIRFVRDIANPTDGVYFGYEVGDLRATDQALESMRAFLTERSDAAHRSIVACVKEGRIIRLSNGKWASHGFLAVAPA